MCSRLTGIVFVLFTVSSWRPCFGEPIHEAARQGDVNAVVTFIDRGVGVDTPDVTGETALMVASLSGQSEVVDSLIRRGANILARNDRGLTALHAASYAGDMRSVQLLVEAGASVNDADNKFNVTPLIIAAEGDYLVVINYLIEHGADVEWKERGGYTALSRALFKKHRKAAEALLKSGAVCQPVGVISAWASEDCIEQRATVQQ